MDTCLRKITKVPIDSICTLHHLTLADLAMKSTDLHPAFLLSLISGILVVCGFAVFLIYFFFADNCAILGEYFPGSAIGVAVLTVIYPVEAILTYLCLVGAVVRTPNPRLKVAGVAAVGLAGIGLPFGGLGFAFLCVVGSGLFRTLSGWFTDGIFIEVVVYGYMSILAFYLVVFIVLYTVLGKLELQ
jgi:hypothetical protein